MIKSLFRAVCFIGGFTACGVARAEVSQPDMTLSCTPASYKGSPVMNPEPFPVRIWLHEGLIILNVVTHTGLRMTVDDYAIKFSSDRLSGQFDRTTGSYWFGDDLGHCVPATLPPIHQNF
jgi:hypothetical protein